MAHFSLDSYNIENSYLMPPDLKYSLDTDSLEASCQESYNFKACYSLDEPINLGLNFNENINQIITPIRNTQKRQPIMRRTSFQARMGRKLDNINRRILDNSIRLSSHPTDMLRIKVNRDTRSQDILTRTIESAEIIPVMLPTMKDIPLRRFSLDNTTNEVLIPSMYPYAESEYYTIYTPMEMQLDEDDLLIRLIYEPYSYLSHIPEGKSEMPYIMALQVKDILSTVGYNSILFSKVQVTFYDEPLPEKLKILIKEANEKRLTLGW